MEQKVDCAENCVGYLQFCAKQNTSSPVLDIIPFPLPYHCEIPSVTVNLR